MDRQLCGQVGSKLWGSYQMLELAWDLRIRTWIIEVDNLGVVKLVNDQHIDLRDHIILF